MSSLAGRNPVRPRRHVLAVAASVGIVVLLVAGCGSGSSKASSSGGAVGTGSSADQSASVDALSVVTPNADPSTVANLVLAENLGYFKAENVTIKRIDGAGAAGASLLVSGQADLLLSSSTIGFPLAKQGQPISVVWSDVGAGLGAALAVASNSSVKTLQDLSGKKVGTIGTTGATYGFANYLSHQVAAVKGGEAFQLVAFNDSATLINALTSGAVAASSASTGTFAEAITAGKVRLVVDTSAVAERTKLLGTNYTVDTAYEGLTANLKTKKESVVRFMEALTKANTYLNTHTPDQISQVIAMDPYFKALTPSTIALSVVARFPFYTPYNGQVSESDWKATLDWFTKWQIPTIGDVASDATFSYAKIVDMSYLNEAQKRLGPKELAPTGGPKVPTTTPSK
jgi:ABC-type nitrate/sulfonate/bicarbonate transport system substrate-binding protein